MSTERLLRCHQVSTDYSIVVAGADNLSAVINIKGRAQVPAGARADQIIQHIERTARVQERASVDASHHLVAGVDAAGVPAGTIGDVQHPSAVVEERVDPAGVGKDSAAGNVA